MAAYAYTVVAADKRGINESIGVMYAESQEEARQKLIANGFLIRDLRPAKAEEINLHSLRQLRNKLDGSNKKIDAVAYPVTAPQRSYGWVIWAIVGALIALALLGGW